MSAPNDHDDHSDHNDSTYHPGDGLAHAHRQRHGLLGRLRHRFTAHSHDVVDKIDTALETSQEGMRALKISLAVLGVTAILQAVVVVMSGSVALLGDTLHNVTDALTAIPLGIAFLVGRRAPNRRYTYGYGRAEDLAGVVIVLAIAASAVFAAYESVARLLDPRDVEFLGAVIAAGLVGFAGNEWVAQYRIRVGRRIGSAALVADGHHARTDGFTSLAVVVGAVAVAAGFRRADPIVGLLITAAILVVLRSVARDVLHRLMDAVDPGLVDEIEHVLCGVPGVEQVGAVRVRWIGHTLHAEADIVVDTDLRVGDGHAIAEAARHDLLHAIPRLASGTIHADPCGHDGVDPHEALSHHGPTPHA